MSRIGNFTSSEIWALTTNGRVAGTKGEKFYSYIEKKRFERRLGRSIDSKTTAKPLSWGKLLEVYLFQKKGLIQYTPLMDEPRKHPLFDFWWGSPDAINNPVPAVAELKCPQTLSSFCSLVEPLMCGLTGIDAINALRNGFTDGTGFKHDKHNDAEKYYWQMVSNAIITQKKYAELIIFCPYKSELEAVRDLAQQMPTEDLGDYYWIGNSNDEQLPYLIDGGKYQNFNSIVFEVPQSDIDFLTSRVLIAEKYLN